MGNDIEGGEVKGESSDRRKEGQEGVKKERIEGSRVEVRGEARGEVSFSKKIEKGLCRALSNAITTQKDFIKSAHKALLHKISPLHEFLNFSPETSSKASHRSHCEKRHEFAFVLQYILRWDYKELNITKSPSQNNKESFRQIHVHDFLFGVLELDL